jgi:four helix bundle protein
MKENVLKEKSSQFAVRIVLFCRDLKNRKVETPMISQILRCGTSIGANIEEASAGISKKEFSMKLSISYKEAKETVFWLRLFRDSGTISSDEYNSLFNDCDEILRILWVILKKTRIGK